MMILAAAGRADHLFALTAWVIKQDNQIVTQGANCARFTRQIDECEAEWLAIQQCLQVASGGLNDSMALLVNSQSTFDALAGLVEPEGIDISHTRRLLDQLNADVRLDYHKYPADPLTKLLASARLGAAMLMAGKQPSPVQKLALELRVKYSPHTIERLAEELIFPTY